MKRNIGIYSGMLAVVLSLLAFFLGAAPFTPAVFLIFISIPLSLTALSMKSLRLGTLGVYFSVFAWLTSPAVGLAPFNSDDLFLALTAAGLILALILCFSWYRKGKAS